MTKLERSVSKQGYLQPRCHSKARPLSRQQLSGLLNVCYDVLWQGQHVEHPDGMWASNFGKSK